MKNTKRERKQHPQRTLYFANETHARDDALREKKLEDKLNSLYALQDRFPDDVDIVTEIEELERELNY